MALHVIVGKGPVGSTTAEELLARGHSVRVLSRSGAAPRETSSTGRSTPPTPTRWPPPHGGRRRSTTP
jgi:glycine/D-amino acid oxidase-like deaminating enzyme